MTMPETNVTTPAFEEINAVDTPKMTFGQSLAANHPIANTFVNTAAAGIASAVTMYLVFRAIDLASTAKERRAARRAAKNAAKTKPVAAEVVEPNETNA